MDYIVRSQPSYSLLEVTLDVGEQLVTDAGAMAWMSPNIDVQTSSRGGVLSGLSRAVLGGESFFQNTYEAREDRGTIGLAPGQPGDVMAYRLDGGSLLLEKGAYLASHGGDHHRLRLPGPPRAFQRGNVRPPCLRHRSAVLQRLRRHSRDRR